MPRHPCNAIDRHIGKRVRKRRHEIGVTQIALAEALNISFQQVQKYENGKNKISASRLFEIAFHLKITREYFFDGLDDQGQQQDCRYFSRTACSYTWGSVASWQH